MREPFRRASSLPVVLALGFYSYHWASVKTLGGTIDVLLDTTLSNKEIVVDGMILE